MNQGSALGFRVQRFITPHRQPCNEYSHQNVDRGAILGGFLLSWWIVRVRGFGNPT